MSGTLNINGENHTVHAFRGKVLQNRTCTTSATTVAGGVFSVSDTTCLTDGREPCAAA